MENIYNENTINLIFYYDKCIFEIMHAVRLNENVFIIN